MNLIDSIRAIVRKPKATPALANRQTDVLPGQGGERAMIGYLHRELSTHPSKGLTPAKLYQILEAAEAGDLREQHALFADMEEKDPQIASDLGKRKQAAAELEWQIVPPEGASRIEKKAAAHAAEVFSALEVEDLIIDLGDGIGHGWAMLELPWTVDGGLRRIEQPRWVDHTWFQLHTENRNDIRLRDASINGESLWPLGWARHIHKAKSGYVSRLGLHRTLVWPYLFQNYALGDLAELLEILGIPARLGEYPRGSTEEEKATLLRAVTSLGHKAAGIIPDGMKIEYLEAANTTSDGYQVMLNWCERAKSKAILGGTLTTGTDAGSGAYALGEVHERGLMSLVASDARQYAGTIRRDILWPMAALNFGIERLDRAPRWFLDTSETVDYKLLSESLPVFVDLGAKIPAWWLHEKTGIPEAQDGEEALKAVAGQVPNPGPNATADDPATLTARLSANRDDPDWAERNADALERLSDPMIRAMVGAIRREMDRAGSLPELRARLLELYPEIDGEDLTALLGRAFVTGHLAGRDEADRSAHRG